MTCPLKRTHGPVGNVDKNEQRMYVCRVEWTAVALFPIDFHSGTCHIIDYDVAGRDKEGGWCHWSLSSGMEVV